jgi:hypothetical protein
MLKKLASLLFEEEEEVIEEELEPKEKPVKPERSFIPSQVNGKDKPIKQERSLISAMNPKPVEVLPVEVKEDIKPIIEDEIKHAPVEEIIKPVKPDFGIAFDEPTPVREKQKVIKEKPIYEFRPVISPMFGVSESKKNQSIKHVVNTPQTLKRSRINTVISPIYGDVENKKSESEPITRMEKPSYKFDPYIEPEAKDLPKFKAENYSLDDLLSPIKPQDEKVESHETTVEEDELAHQFSLFDDMK